MSNAVKALQGRALQTQVWMQIVLISATAVVFWWMQDAEAAVASLYGGSIAVVNSLLQLWHLGRAARTAGASPERNVRIIYRCMLERYVVTAALFALAIGIIGMTFLPLLAGFIVGQLALFFGSLRKRV